RYADGTTVWKYPDGRQIVQRGDGSVIQQNADGSTFQKNADGTIVRKYPDGVVSVQGPDGSRRRQMPDGTRVDMQPDGKVGYVDNGQGGVRQFSYGQDGMIAQVKSMDGSVWSRQGQDYWTDNRGRTWRGVVRGVDQDGNAYYQPSDGSDPFILSRQGNV